MDIENAMSATKPTIRCTQVPLKLLEKKAAKEHFSQFGRLVKLSLKIKIRECTVQYDSRESAEVAIANAGYYQGDSFPISWGIKKTKQSKKVVDPDWELDPEVKAELEAMSNEFSVKRKYNLRPEGMAVDVEPPAAKKERKLKRISRKIERPVIAVTKATNVLNMDKQELLSKLKYPALTVEEKFRLLDTRDKLIRLMRAQKQVDISKTKRTVGTCPDMCPEKERLMREVQHQVALYEQESGDRTMNHVLAVKQYSRSSADQEAPLPHELRNVDVLQMTMDYLMRKIMNLCDLPDTNLAEWYHFLWDRTRGIRKDITQQELCCQGSVELIEQCARFHIHCSARLVAEDTSVFDSKINTENLTKCLQTLKYMYHDLALKGEHCPNESEFRAYIILLNLNDGNFMWEVQQLKQEIQKSQEIRFALDVYSAIDKNNYTKFFKLVRSTTYLNACILLRYFLQIRTRAVSTIIKSYAPRAAPHTQFPLEELKNILAFEGINSTIDFFEYFGLMVNEERTHVVLDRLKYSTPDYPYMLDRAVAVIESKRMNVSVGEIVCGREFIGEFVEHPVKSSFDENGYLDLSEFEMDDLAEVKSLHGATQRSFSPFRKSKVIQQKVLDTPGKIFSSITAQINKNADLFKSTSSEATSNTFSTDKNVNLFKSSSSEAPMFNMHSTDNIKIFKSTTESPMFNPFTDDKNIPSQNFDFSSIKTADLNKKTEIPSSNIFSLNKIEQTSKGEALRPSNTFKSRKNEPTETNIFSTQTPALPGDNAYTLFPANNSDKTFFPKQTTFNQSLSNKTNDIFRSQTTQSSSFFGGNRNNTSSKISLKRSASDQTDSALLKTFVSDQTNNTSLKTIASDYTATKKIEGGFHYDLSATKETEEKAGIDEEKVKRLRENEMRYMREKAEEEANKRRLELQRKLEELKREEEIRKQESQIKHAVKVLMDELITQVEKDYNKERLEYLRHNMIKRQVIANWRKKIVINKRKRKAIDQSPVWLSAKTQKEVASELFSRALVTTSLDLRKRYKKGVSVNLMPEKLETINKVNLTDIAGEKLVRKLKQREIYWKINVVTQGINELVEKAFDDYLDWKENNGLKYLLQQDSLASNKMTYCIQKLSPACEIDEEADGFIFISNELNDTLLKRIYKLSLFPTSIVLILQNYPANTAKLDELVNNNVIRNYHIESGLFTRTTCIEYFNQAIIFLAINTNEKQLSPLLDTLKSFLLQHLGSELWHRISSFTKWNYAYKQTLTSPNTAINLHNEAVELIKQTAFSDICYEHPNFPEIFKEFLPSKIPNNLPCDYKYFPAFWKNSNYKKYVLNIINSLKLPKYQSTWPPKDKSNLQQVIFNYCAKIFDNPQRVFYKIMAYILKNPETILWSGIIEIITLENIGEINYDLPDKIFSSNTIFNQLFVIYDSAAIKKYSKEAWFYVTNPIVKDNLDESLNEPEDVSVEEKVDYEVDLINDTIEEISVPEDYKKQLNNITALMDDLEESMAIQREISRKVQSTLESFLDDIRL